MQRRTERIGLVFAALCALNGAFVPAFAKLTTNVGSPFFVAAATTCFAGGFAAVVLAVHAELSVLVRRGLALRLVGVGALGTAAPFMLFYSGAHRSTAIEAALCLQIEPVYSLLAAWLVLHHVPTPRRIAAIGVLLAGIVLAVGTRGIAASSGVWLLLVTPLCWQASHLLVLRGLPGVSPLVLTGARYVDGGVLLAVLWWLSEGGATLPQGATLVQLLPLLAVQGIVLAYVGTLAWYQAIARLDLARTTAIVVPSIPVLSLGASFLLLGEIPSLTQALGMVLIASGVLAFVTAPDASGQPIAEASAAPVAGAN